MPARFVTVDEYQAALPEPIRAALTRVREVIRQAVPDGQEAIRYQIPTIILNGRQVVSFAAWRGHLAVYPIPATDAPFTEELARYRSGRSTLRFPLNEPIPYQLIAEVATLLAAQRAGRPASPEPTTLLTGRAFVESPRWHDGKLWFCDWGTREIVTVGLDGATEVAAELPSAPFCLDFTGDGRLLVVSGRQARLLVGQDDGQLATYADLSSVDGEHPWNEIAVDGRGNVYLNNIGFDFPGGQVAPGIIAVVRPDGTAEPVADGLGFPNGMAVTPDGSTLIVAESYASQLTAFDIHADGRLSNRRVWAGLDHAAPDGICLDADGAVWYADVPNTCCVRVREGGDVLQRITLDRGCFSCTLGGPGGDTLFLLTAQWTGPQSLSSPQRTGQVLTVPAPAAGAGRR